MATTTPWTIIFVILFASPTKASSWEDFTNNLASDLAPLISLFGEQVTKQFLSESTTFLDTVIFAAAPLGILTAVVSAIRVCGNTSLRAFVGRAQEGRGNVEAELCSSTSFDVCELWNRGGIARVLGSPQIVELVYDESLSDFYGDLEDPDSPVGESSRGTVGLFLPRDYFASIDSSRSWKEMSSRRSLPLEEDKHPLLEKSDSEDQNPEMKFAPNPNLSLNIGIRQHPTPLLWSVAIFGCLLQASVIGFSYWITYIARYTKDGEPVKPWGFPLSTMGTCLLVLGVGMCSWLIDRSTEERHFRRKSATGTYHPYRVEMFWLQPGNQSVGDQTFEAFAFRACPDRYLTSWRPEREKSIKDLLRVWSAIGLSMVGFVLQFVGIRALHSSVALYQLGATLTMSMIRSLLRSDRLDQESNLLRGMNGSIQGHELDWQACLIQASNQHLDELALASTWQWNITGSTVEHLGPSSQFLEVEESNSKHEARIIRRLMENVFLVSYERKSHVASYDQGPLENLCARNALQWISETELAYDEVFESKKKEKYPMKPNPAVRYLYTRSRLANLTEGGSSTYTNTWNTQVRECARRLQKAIEGTSEYIFSSESGLHLNAAPSAIVLRLDCSVDVRGASTYPIHFLVHQSSGRWHIDSCMLEAVLGLWTWSLKKDKHNLPCPLRKVFATARNPEDLEKSMTILKLWAYQKSKPIRRDFWKGTDYDRWREELTRGTSEQGLREPLSIPICQNLRDKSRGNETDWDIAAIYEDYTGSEVELAAQDLFTSFFGSITNVLERLDHIAPVHSTAEGIDLDPVDKIQDWFGLANSHVDDLVKIFAESGVGSQEEGYVSIVSALHAKSKLPAFDVDFENLISLAGLMERNHKFQQTEDLLKYLYFECRKGDQLITTPHGREHVSRQLGCLYLTAIKFPDESVQKFGCNGISWILDKNGGTRDVKSMLLAAFQCFSLTGNVKMMGFLQNLLDSSLKEEFMDSYRVLSHDRNATLLHSAVNAGYSELVDDLIRSEDVDSTDSEGCTPVILAAKLGHGSMIRNFAGAQANCNYRDNNGRSALSWAAGNGMIDALKELMETEGIDLGLRDKCGRTPLLWATKQGEEATVRLLLRATAAEVDLKDNNGRTPLSWAAGNGHIGIARTLLSLQAVKVDSEDHSGRTPLSWAAGNGKKAVVNLLLSFKAANIESRDQDGRTALSWAAGNGQVETVSILLAVPAVKVNSKDKSGRTPFSWAVLNGQKITSKLLMDYLQADADLPDDQGRTPLLVAAREGKEALVETMMSWFKLNLHAVDIEGRSLLSYLAQKGNSKLIQQLLLEKLVKLDLSDVNGRTPLSWAAGEGHGHTVQLLLQAGADADTVDNNGRTPLLWATKSGNSQAIVNLMDTPNINVNARDTVGHTILFWLAQNADAKLMRKLLDGSKMNPNLVDKDGRTLLSWAAEKDNRQIAEILLHCKDTLIDYRDNNGKTPVLWAAQSGNAEIMEMMLEKGGNFNVQDNVRPLLLSWLAKIGHTGLIERLLDDQKPVGLNLNLPDQEGRTPLSWAVGKGHISAVKLLLQKSYIDVNASDEKGWTALHWAAHTGNEAMASILLSHATINANARDHLGRTPLLLAHTTGSWRIARLIRMSGQ